ncbi:NAD(P)H-dependent oxidoreductase [Paenibacillus sp. R14(2021)]|uniref:NAD(P)H-dependent oxidoreductase n=1 Tax=Paenibacillus sp. R14(2021) TaxID=2859228 RepID=UPI001C612816|nr:NAD(P)H-dependent oxidoreductase [Paenibacillus sp. R14(2021)]
MKTLVIVVHPNIEQSRINKSWMQALQEQSEVTVHQLYPAYPDFKIDAAKEQALLEAHDRVIFQFPFYWYSSPALLKEWFDRVLAHGWAYGPGGDKLHGKEWGIAISTSGPQISYQPDGHNHYTLDDLTKPFKATSSHIGTTFITPFILNGVTRVSDEELAQNTLDYVKFVTSMQPASV